MLPDATPPATAPVRYTAPAASVFTGTKGSTAPAAATGSWVWPTNGCYITVYFNQYYRYGLHKGLDVDGDYASDIFATKSGTITRASWYDGYGNCIDIDHGGGYSSRYGHASKFFVSVGDYVEAGQVIGKVGTTGRSSGTHLHFEIMENSVKLNPLNFIRCK
jgi:murein DD-endopeptidase MepM/ murein hydrolase activator NlpD